MKLFLPSLLLFLAYGNVSVAQIYKIKNNTSSVVKLQFDYNLQGSHLHGNNEIKTREVAPGGDFTFENTISTNNTWWIRIYSITPNKGLKTKDGNLWVGRCSTCSTSGTYEIVTGKLCCPPPPPPTPDPVPCLTYTGGWEAEKYPFNEPKPANAVKLRYIAVWWGGCCVKGIKFTWEDINGNQIPGKVHGTADNNIHEFKFEDDEYLRVVKGRSGKYIDQIIFVTNKRTYGPYGGGGGSPYESRLMGPDWQINGIHGTGSGYIDKIGFYATSNKQGGRYSVQICK